MCQISEDRDLGTLGFYSLDESHDMDQLNPTAKFNFLRTHFKILQPNLNRYNQRKTFEGVSIKMLKPKLNEQIQSRSVSLI